jgi:hypothetical protein
VTCLSIIDDGGPSRVVANPIFAFGPVQVGAEMAFEVLETNASELEKILGQTRLFYIDKIVGVFRARLQSLEQCSSRHEGLALLRDSPTLRCVLVVGYPDLIELRVTELS